MLRSVLQLSPLGLLAAACASGPGAAELNFRRPEVPWAAMWPELAAPAAAASVGSDGAFPARRPDAAGFERLQAAERLWRAKDEAGFAAARDELAGEPLLAFWLARLLIRDALFLRENARADESALVGDLPWQAPFDQLVALGAAAAPCVVLDLLRQRAADRNELGAEVLHAMGPAAMPSWERILEVADPAVRRHAVRAMAGWEGDPRVLDQLLDATRDPDFGVRAAAWRGVGLWGSDQGPRLRQALAADQDPFVQRAIVEGLGRQADRDSASAVVDFLERAAAQRDEDGVEAAHRALATWSGRAERDSAPGWRRWLSQQGGR
jgi:hypothetical protein